MGEYLRRIVDDELDELFAALPAIALEGPKGVGKTATAERRSATTFRLDIPAQRAVAAADPHVVVSAPPPVLIDEWQHVPSVWDAVRREVDRDLSPGRYLLAGSAAPLTPPTHSGAGRIVSVRLRPLALSERGICPPSVSLGELLRGGRPPISGETSVGLSNH